MKINKNNLALLTDLYELAMAAVYYQHQMVAPATFSLFIRDYPPNRGYFISAGLFEVLDFLESFRFTREDLDYLESTGLFSDDFLQYLADLRFTGDMVAIPEGRIFFRDEPILEITAPIIEAQLVESLIINAINLQVTIATKASRCVYASQKRTVVDFALRRTQGTDAAIKVARASYIVGFKGTSNVLAGRLYGMPIYGTMAHSFVCSFKEEINAFRAFSEIFPQNTVLLIDTYDTIKGAHKAVSIAREMAKRGEKLNGVRLDSGDLVELSKEVRAVLRQAGFNDVSIFASGGLDEFDISRLLENGSEIDAFGIGTKMGVSADAPYTDMAYKLVQYNRRPVLKLSPGKLTLVGEKQVFRRKSNDQLIKDFIGLRHEDFEGEPLLNVYMKNGKRTQPSESLQDIRERFLDEFSLLDESCKRLEKPATFPVGITPDLEELQDQITRDVKQNN